MWPAKKLVLGPTGTISKVAKQAHSLVVILPRHTVPWRAGAISPRRLEDH